jgi:CheY-like chemotaxis protein
MDGVEATQAIRRGEAKSIHADIPIIAMTANAMKGDKEKCLAAGMNDYATKPVDAKVLQEKLCYWLGVKGEPAKQSNEENNEQVIEQENTREINIEQDSVVWQRQSFLQRIRNNEKIANNLISLFLEDSPQLIDEISTAIEHNEYQKIQACSHKLKGSTKNIGGQRLSLIIEQIESAANTQQVMEINMHKTALVKEFELLCHELKGFEFIA